jgi:hypothetical protein
METKYWTKVKEFHGIQIIRDPDTMQSRIISVPQHKKPVAENLVITNEMRLRAEEALHLYSMLKNAEMRASAKASSPLSTVKPEPKPMSFEEQLAHDWRFNPAIRKEFFSFGAYQAFMRAEKAGKISVCGMS